MHLSVRVGSSSTSFRGQQLNVTHVFVHDKYDYDREYKYDLALLKTATPIKLGKLAKPIKLAKTAPVVGSSADDVGFGDTKKWVSFRMCNVKLHTVMLN